ncbi:hypothetical protein [Streptomyces sp. NPDC054952]
MEIYDEDTGLIRSHRVDPAARIYYENGEKAKRKARGTKWFFASGRDTGYWTRVILSFAHVGGGECEDEAAIAVRQFRMLKDALPDCMGVVYDGAFRGVHRDALARTGLLAINKQRGSVAPVFYERVSPCRRGHELWCDQGRIAESIRIDDGTRILEPLPIIKLEHRAGATKSRCYHLLKIPCRHGDHDYRVSVGITTTPADRSLRSTDTGQRLKSDTERGFHRAEYLQQIPEASLTHQLLYPYRADSESVHSQFDQSLWNRRMIAYGVERQKIFVLASPSPRTPPATRSTSKPAATPSKSSASPDVPQPNDGRTRPRVRPSTHLHLGGGKRTERMPGPSLLAPAARPCLRAHHLSPSEPPGRGHAFGSDPRPRQSMRPLPARSARLSAVSRLPGVCRETCPRGHLHPDVCTSPDQHVCRDGARDPSGVSDKVRDKPPPS